MVDDLELYIMDVDHDERINDASLEREEDRNNLMTELKFSGQCDIEQVRATLEDPGDKFKTIRSIKISTVVDIGVINQLLGGDASLFWDEEINARWPSIKRVALDVALTKHQCSIARLDLGDVKIKSVSVSFLPMGRAEMICTIHPGYQTMGVADQLQQAVNRTAIELSIHPSEEF